MAEIENISISISASANSAIKSLEKLASVLSRVNGIMNGFNASNVISQLSSVSNAADNAANSLGSFASAQRRASSAMRGTARSANEATNAIVRLNNAVANVQDSSFFRNFFNNGRNLLTGNAPIFTEFADEAEHASGRIVNATKSMSEMFHSAGASIMRTFSALGSGIGVLGRAALSIPRFFGGQLIKNIKTSVAGLGQFFAMIKRVALYRLIRTALKSITKGISDGMKHLYNYSNAINGQFAASMRNLASSTQYLGNSMAAMISPLYNAIVPVVNAIIDRVVVLINLINQLFAALSGKGSYTAAKKVAADLSGAAGAANGAAKELKRTILGFDELNILQKQNSGGGGGGGGAGGAGMFEEVPIDNSVSEFADKLREAWENQDWQALGQTLGNKFNEIIDSVDWSGIGSKVGTYINGWFSTKYWTLDTINFTNIGSNIAEFLNNAIEKIDFNTLGRYMVKKMTIIGDMIIGFFTDFNWGEAAGKLSDFVNGLFEELSKWLVETDWTSFGKKLGEGLLDVVLNIDYVGIARSIITLLDDALESAVELLGGFFDGLAEKFKAATNWDGLSTEIQTAIEAIMAVLGLATGVIGAILTFSGVNIPLGIGMMIAGGLATGTALSLMWDGLSDNIKDHIELIKGVLYGGILAVGAVLAFSGANIPLGIGMMIAGAVGLGKTVAENWDAIIEKIRGPIGVITGIISGATLVLGIFALISGNIPLGLGLIMAGAAGLASTISANWDSLKQLGEDAIGKVKEGWETVKELAITAWVALKKKVGEWADAVWTFLKDAGSTIAKTIMVGVDKATTWVNDAWAALRIQAGEVYKTIKAGVDKASTWVADAWTAAKMIAGTVFKTVKAAVDKAGTWVADAWVAAKMVAGTIFKYVKSGVDKAGTWVADAWTAARMKAETVFKTVKAGVDKASTWVADAWTASKMTAGTIFKTVKAGVDKANTWVADAWAALRMKADTVYKTVKAGVDKANTWVADAWAAAKMSAGTVYKSIKSSVDKANTWISDAWIAAKMNAGTIYKTVKSNIDKGSTWVNDAWQAAKMAAGSITKSILASIGTGKNWWQAMWDFLIGPNSIGKELVITITTSIAKEAKKFWDWLWGDSLVGGGGKGTTAGPAYTGTSLGTPTIDIPLNGVATGAWHMSGTNKYSIADIAPGSVAIKGKAAGGLEKYNSSSGRFKLRPIADTSVTIVGKKAAELKNIKKFLTGNDDGKVTVKINASNASSLNELTQHETASGGVFSNGIWRSIPQYASGTSNAHGSLFLAGEAGPEIVGHVGGRTEVLNKSQLAAAMFSAVRSAMSGVRVSADINYDSGANVSDENIDALMELVRVGSEATQRQNDLLRQQNEYLRTISDKEFSTEITTSSINRAQNRMNRRAGTTIVPIGT